MSPPKPPQPTASTHRHNQPQPTSLNPWHNHQFLSLILSQPQPMAHQPPNPPFLPNNLSKKNPSSLPSNPARQNCRQDTIEQPNNPPQLQNTTTKTKTTEIHQDKNDTTKMRKNWHHRDKTT